MAKDYFQDILPPTSASPGRPVQRPLAVQKEEDTSTDTVFAASPDEPTKNPAPPERSIRNISVSPRPPRRFASAEREIPGMQPPRPRRRFISARLWIWLVAALSVIVLGAILMVALRPTTVTIVPRAHAIVFDAFFQFTAYPGAEAELGMLSYTIETAEFEDSAVVPSTGVEVVEERARGFVTVVNNYSEESVRLIANTRFATPEGLIFRTSSAVTVPGKTGTRAGELRVEVVADEAGERYNVGPVSRFTLPGLATTPVMYADVYARSTEAMSGGFSGERPSAAPEAVEAARAQIRARLEAQARGAAELRTNEDTVALADLARVTYSSLPTTAEAGGGVRLRERALVEMPIFPAASFARTASRGVSADAEEGTVMMRNIGGLTARMLEVDDDFILGSSPFNFTLEGTAQVVWKVDAAELAASLAGREEAAFRTIAATFPGIEDARARIQPFWKKSFPDNPDDIQVHIEEPNLPGT